MLLGVLTLKKVAWPYFKRFNVNNRSSKSFNPILSRKRLNLACCESWNPKFLTMFDIFKTFAALLAFELCLIKEGWTSATKIKASNPYQHVFELQNISLQSVLLQNLPISLHHWLMTISLTQRSLYVSLINFLNRLLHQIMISTTWSWEIESTTGIDCVMIGEHHDA